VKTILITIAERGPDLNLVIRTFIGESSTERERFVAQHIRRLLDENINSEVSVDITIDAPAKVEVG
jgi:hypothetical protein